MSKIDEMLKNEKVEWKKLGDVCEIVKGKQFNRKHMLEDGKYPVINGGISPSGFVNVFNTNKNCVTVSQGGASAGYVNFIETDFWLGAHAFAAIPKSDKIKEYGYNYETFNKFIFYILKNNQLKLQDSKVGAGIPSISKDDLSKIKIPITSIKIQDKIVNYLDEFTDYSVKIKQELQKELNLRNKQYEFYRDKLLSEEQLYKLINKFKKSDVIKILSYKKISDLCLRQKGIKITAKEMKELNSNNSSVKVFAGGNTSAMLSRDEVGEENILNKPSVIVKSRGNIDFEYYDEAFTHKNEMWSYSSLDENKLNIKYLYYVLRNNLKYFRDNAISGKLPQISTGLTDNYKVPLPNIYIQNQIVEILDKFDELIKNVGGLLSDEIEKREKQYEYYREKLLTFDTQCTRGGVPPIK